MKKNEKLVIAVDFDGTIVEHNFPKIGDLLPFAKEVINKLHKEGYYIIIWTCRGEYSLIDMINFLDKNKIHYDKINENAPYEILGFKPFPKIVADIYIDDRNLGGFPGWLKTYKILTEKDLLCTI